MCYKLSTAFGHWIKAPPANRAEVLILGPKLLQAGFAAATDFCTYLFARRLYGQRSHEGTVVAALAVLSPWSWFAGTRTFSNSLETTLTILAISQWPWEWSLEHGEDDTSGKKKEEEEEEEERSAADLLMIPIAAAAGACILRPTNVLIWATITFSLIGRGMPFKKIFELAQAGIIFGGSVLAASAALDKHFYGDWVFPQLKFVEFNLVQSLAVFYGKNRVDYYFTEGLPLLLTTALPFTAIGLYNALRPPQTKQTQSSEAARTKTIESILAYTVVTSVIALSLIGHKEVRFLYPLLPLLHLLAANPILNFFEFNARPPKIPKLAILGVLVAINLGIAVYTSHFHQRGVVEVTHYLRHQYEEHYLHLPPSSGEDGKDPEMNVGFLMPCHSTPWRSHLVYPDISAWALTCEPPIHLPLEQRESYLDEADIFYKDPSKWIDEHMANMGTRKGGSGIGGPPAGVIGERRPWPEYLVFFEQLLPALEEKLEGSEYKECWREFNSHWHDDWRRKGDVVVWCMRS